MSHRLSKRRAETIGAVSALGLLAFLAVEPVAAQEFGGGQIETTFQNLLRFVLRWALVIGTVITAFAHLYAGWTSNEDKAWNRKEWRNRAAFGTAGALPILIILNEIIVAFGGAPIDFLPVV